MQTMHLTLRSSGAALLINSAHVRLAEPAWDGGTTLWFDGEHKVVVADDYKRVFDMLQAALDLIK